MNSDITFEDSAGAIDVALHAAGGFPQTMLGKPVEIVIAGQALTAYLLRVDTRHSGGRSYTFTICANPKPAATRARRKAKTK